MMLAILQKEPIVSLRFVSHGKECITVQLRVLLVRDCVAEKPVSVEHSEKMSFVGLVDLDRGARVRILVAIDWLPDAHQADCSMPQVLVV